MKIEPFIFKSKVWLYQGDSPWHFATVDKKTSEQIKKEYPFPRRGFGSIPVNASIGKSNWKTSIFPDKDGTFLLPLKKEIRKKESIKVGDILEIILTVLI